MGLTAGIQSPEQVEGGGEEGGESVYGIELVGKPCP